jgi:transposase
VGKPEGSRPLGRPRLDGRIILKWIFERLGGGVDWIDLAQDRDRWRDLVYTVMNIRVPQNAGNFLSSLGHFSFSGRTLLHGVS